MADQRPTGENVHPREPRRIEITRESRKWRFDLYAADGTRLDYTLGSWRGFVWRAACLSWRRAAKAIR